MGAGSLAIRSYRPGDEEAINRSFNRVFNCARSLAEWGWKFPVEPAGRVISLAERDGEVLTHYAGIPVRLQIDGRVWAAAQIADVYSVPEARGSFSRRGPWVQTVEHFFSTFGHSGRVALLFGFPGPRHRRLGILQLGYDSMEPQPIAYWRRRAAPRRRSLRSRLYRAELARDWEPRLSELWQRVRTQYPVAVVRDAEHALRRYAGRPGVQYHRFLVFPRFSPAAVAWVVFRADGGVCRWVDFLWDRAHPGALEMVAALGSRLTRQTGAEGEEMWLNGDLEGAERLTSLGFARSPEPRELQMVARAFDAELDLGHLEERVYLTLGDSDLE